MTVLINDVHSKLNETRGEAVRTPATLDELRHIVRSAATAKQPLAVCGARHAMGGQQFLFATKDQLLRAYPELSAFLEEKKRFDQKCRFQSNWYRCLDGLLRS